ncbi:MAG: hypothetical protein G8345_11930 [Magnetococcales bacterium]|nr:membrane integrity-associated transporter subunit PqiC [Magnetococcales bacterium]NGZ27581.1 hypothetical protein [Magnetococcales bacterium]
MTNQSGWAMGRLGWPGLGILLLLLAGCSSSPPAQERWFRLGDPPTVTPLARPLLSESVELVSFTAQGLLAGEQSLLYRDMASPHEVRRYALWRWVDPPAKLVRSILLRNLQQLGIFRQLVERRQQIHSNYLLTGDLWALEQRLQGKETVVALEVELTLVNRESQEVRFNQHYRLEERAEGAEISAAMDAFDRMLARWCQEVNRDMTQALIRR